MGIEKLAPSRTVSGVVPFCVFFSSNEVNLPPTATLSVVLNAVQLTFVESLTTFNPISSLDSSTTESIFSSFLQLTRNNAVKANTTIFFISINFYLPKIIRILRVIKIRKLKDSLC